MGIRNLRIFRKKEQVKEMMTDDPYISSIFGLAIADAVGVPAEFKSRDELRTHPIKDMVGHGTHNQPLGTWSDDSSMMIATIDSINECDGIDYDDIMKKFSEWVRQSKYTATGEFFDIGISTRTAIGNYLRGVEPTKCGCSGERENGNGSLMRILPFVLYSYSQGYDFDKEVAFINDASSLTHSHEISRLGCKIYADYVRGLLDGMSKEEALDNLRKIDYTKHYSSNSISCYRRILDGSLSRLSEDEIKSTGFVVDTLEASIWCNLKTNNYEDAVLKAVNLGDDTDTVGAVTGSLAGIMYGYKNIPSKWREQLISKEYLGELSNKFVSTLNNQNKKRL